MNLNCGLIGLPMVGKTTIFNLLTGVRAETSDYLTGKTETNLATVLIPDYRLDYLGSLFQDRMLVYPQIQFSDMPGLVRGSSQGEGVGNRFLDAIRTVDMLVHVVRAFASKDIPHIEGAIIPLRDLETINLELLFADMEIIERRIDRIKKTKKIKKEEMAELVVLEKCLSALENEMPIEQIELNEEERKFIKNYGFLTEKPMLLVINVDEMQYRSKKYPGKSELEDYASVRGMPVLEICGRLEMEIDELPEEDRKLFLADLGIEKSGIYRLARAAFEHLGLISFFTLGDREIKAWAVKKGTTAIKAAGKVHTDMERGFIKAEVVKFNNLEKLGAITKVKEEGLFRLEGRGYPVEDGDVIYFRFNV